MLAAATATLVGVAGQLSAAPNVASSVVPIVPCRLFDTRPATAVGSRTTPIGAGEAATFLVWGTNGNCTIPNTATGIAANVTTINGTENSFLTVFPADATRPVTSNQNWLAGDPANPNQLSVGLSPTGEIKVFNQFGSVDVIVDIFGYLVAAGGAPAPSAAFDSDAAASTTAAVQADFADFTGGTLIRDLTLPAGSYDIKATTSVRGASDGPAAPALNTRVRCNLVNATGTPVELDTFFQDFFQPDEAAPGFREDLEVGALVTFTVQTKVELRCYSIRPGGGDGAGLVSSSKLIATQVGAITAGH